MYLHIVVEVVCAILIVAYVRRSTRRLEAQIRDLNQIVQQQQEMIHMHHRILQAHGWTSEAGRGPPSRTAVPSPLEDVSISDMTKMFKVPFTTEKVVILPHPTLARQSAGTTTILVEENVPEFPSQTIVDESDSPSIDDEIAEEIQELVKEEEKQAMTTAQIGDVAPTPVATQEDDVQSTEPEPEETVVDAETSPTE